MSENEDDRLRESVLHFYDQLAKESDTTGKKYECSTSLTSGKLTKRLKVDPSRVNLSKTLDKITQKEVDRKKAFRQKKRKKEFKLKQKTGQSSSMEEPQNFNIDAISTETKSSESITVVGNKYVNILHGIDELSNTTYEQLYISCKPQNDGGLLVTVHPNSKLHIIGYYTLQVILGSVSVLGYKFKKNEKHVIYSPGFQSILSISCLDGFQVKKYDSQQIKDLGIPLEFVQDLNISMDQPVVILKLYRYCSNITQIFDESKITNKDKKIDVCLWKETLDVELVEEPDKCRVPLLNESEEWTSYIEKIQSSLISSSKNIFVVTGGKGVGKSTFLKYIINKFLSTFEVSRVACIDLDPGQPEFSLPGCLTLSVCSTPLLGPSFSHHENTHYEYQKQILLGDVSVNHVMNEYLNIASYLYSVYKERFSGMPLVVNTMGFTAVTGYDIMIDILRIIEPTHVINIESTSANKNYPTKLTPEIVSSSNRGILGNNFKNLNYNLTIFKSISKETTKSVKSRLTREINIMGYLSLLWKRNEKNLTCHTLKMSLKINWRTVAIHIHRSSVHPSRLLLAINGSLVVLCRLGEEFLYQIDASQPLKIHYNMSSLLSCVCLGWGVVRGIDPITQEISIFTPLDTTELRRVNMVAMPNVQLPVYFRNYFSTKRAPYVTNVTKI